MHLPRLVRTTSFRLTLLYAGLFSASVLLLFGAMIWYGTGYMADEIDRNVANEVAEIESNAAGHRLADWQRAVAKYSDEAASGVYYLLQDASGRKLAGNIPALRPVIGVRSWRPHEDGGRFPGSVNGVRGRGVRVAGGGYLFVGLDSYELGAMREMITHAFTWGIVCTIVLALTGGIVMSIGLLRRVEAISKTSRDIVAGDLSRRIPARGANDEFDHLAASLNAMLDRIAGLMDGMRQVSSDIAHDLRTPLTRLRQRLELARRRVHSVAALHEALDGSIREVDAILDTFGALLRIAQIESRFSTADFVPIDLTEMLSGMVETYQSVAEEKGQAIADEIAPGLSVAGDRELLPQLFSNLIENAIRHCPQGAKIEVRARAVPGGAEVIVADDGPGIPPALREKVFQRFYRLERSRTTEGTGLGLSLAAAVAAMHHASLALADNGPGLSVRMVFPPAGRGPRPAERTV